MRITSVEVYRYVLSYAHGDYAMSGGRVASRQDSTLVRVSTDEGLQGWGEACPLAGTYLPASPGAVRAALAELAPAVLELDPREVGVVQDRMTSILRGAAAARSAVDIACWDILGQATGQPIAVLLGGVRQDTFPLYEAVPLAEPARMAEFITARQAAGIACFQVKIGNEPLEDAHRLHAAVSAADSGTTIIGDANGGWRLDDAVRGARAVEELPVRLEQPCRRAADCAQVRRISSLPLVMDESVTGPEELHEAKHLVGAGAVNLKLGRLGGITATRLLRDLALELGLIVSLEDSWGGDVVTAAVAHLAASTAPDDLLSTSFFNDWTLEHVADPRPMSRRGRGAAPTAPGLGVEIDAGRLGDPLLTVS